LENMAGIALTHLHADHGSGLEGLGYYNRYELERLERIPLFAGPVVADMVQRRPEGSCYAVQEVAQEAATQVGPFRIQARWVCHGEMPAYAFRIEVGGRTLGHSGDTVFDPELIRWLSAADFVIHEIGTTEIGSTHHTAYAELLTLPPEARTKMHVAHYGDSFNISASAIEPLRQWRVYEV
jgi:ribonuclease BN (tRNA processing enzyme)